MKRLICILSCIFCCGIMLHAQTPQEQFEASLPDTVKYYLAQYAKGRITYKDGGFSSGTFNVSTLDQTVRFVAEDNSLLALSNMADVDRVSVGGVLFIRNGRSFIAVVDSSDDILFGVTKRLEMDKFSKKGAMGMESQTAAVTTVGAITATGNIFNLDNGTKYSIKEYPYLYRKNSAYVASKNSFLKLFPSRKAEINDYLNNHKVDFTKVEDVTGLFEFVKSL